MRRRAAKAAHARSSGSPASASRSSASSVRRASGPRVGAAYSIAYMRALMQAVNNEYGGAA